MPIYACQIGAVNILPMVRKYLDWQVPHGYCYNIVAKRRCGRYGKPLGLPLPSERQCR